MAGFGYTVLGFGSGGAGKPYNVRYLVVAGGGSGGSSQGGGGGGGGFRTICSKSHEVVSGKTYAITVGAGGPAMPSDVCSSKPTSQFNGNNSIFDTITSAGGGAGGFGTPTQGCLKAQDGGSGGGVGRYHNPSPAGGSQPADVLDGGAGNTPDAPSVRFAAGGGGGGAGAARQNANSPPGAGGNGAPGSGSNIQACLPGMSGGGAGGGDAQQSNPKGNPGGDGGGAAGQRAVGTAGGANQGGGGGAGGGGNAAGAGGSGKVIIRRVTACSPGASGGTTQTVGDDTIHVFNSPGTFTA